MSKKVYANGKAIAAKAGKGKAIAAFPDVCMSPPPPPAGPVPIPFPNSSFSKDLKKGSKSVKIGGKPAAIKGSFYKTSPLGNEAATKNFGASLITHQTSGKTEFMAYSFDVKIEGKGVCRHEDSIGSNCGSQPPSALGFNLEGREAFVANCGHPEVRREPPLEEETRTTEELASSLDDQASQLDAIATEKDRLAGLATDPGEIKKLKKGARDTRKGAQHKRFESLVARDTNAKEVEVKIFCAICDAELAEFDVITGNGVHKEVKYTGKAVSVKQLYKEKTFAKLPQIAPPGAVVHLAVPGGERAAARKRFVRPDSRAMTNKGQGYDSVIQEH